MVGQESQGFDSHPFFKCLALGFFSVLEFLSILDGPGPKKCAGPMEYLPRFSATHILLRG